MLTSWAAGKWTISWRRCKTFHAQRKGAKKEMKTGMSKEQMDKLPEKAAKIAQLALGNYALIFVAPLPCPRSPFQG